MIFTISSEEETVSLFVSKCTNAAPLTKDKIVVGLYFFDILRERVALVPPSGPSDVAVSPHARASLLNYGP